MKTLLLLASLPLKPIAKLLCRILSAVTSTEQCEKFMNDYEARSERLMTQHANDLDSGKITIRQYSKLMAQLGDEHDSFFQGNR